MKQGTPDRPHPGNSLTERVLGVAWICLLMLAVAPFMGALLERHFAPLGDLGVLVWLLVVAVSGRAAWKGMSRVWEGHPARVGAAALTPADGPK